MKSQHQATNRNSFDSFAKRLKLIRDKRGVSLGALAGGKPSTAKSWESGVTPRPDMWEQLAKKLDVSVSLLFLGHPKSKEDYEFVAKYADEIVGAEALARQREAPPPETMGHRIVTNGPPPMVASRITPAPGAPSTRADCEVFFAELLDAAGRSGNPNAFPVIYDWLRENFPAQLRGVPKPDST